MISHLASLALEPWSYLCFILAARERASSRYPHLVTEFVFVKLVLDVLRNSALILSYRVYVIPPAPKLSVAVLVFKLAELLI